MAAPPLEISVEETAGLLAARSDAPFRLVDCREEDEWRICRIEGAELMPLTRFGEEAVAKLPDKSQRIVIYCHHGMRSLRAAGWLRQTGFENVQSMAGGIAAWADYVDPEMPRY
ncbi:MAG: rhodanese-like domain-containing protein [Verrucomicrobiaceae bacterium]|nr:rhodanese-like domain-containing protein [Verrucomicrobiaceae bacterium]